MSRAGLLPQPSELIDLEQIERDYYQNHPDYSEINHRVLFGTSGHRGTARGFSFTEAHIVAITQAIVDYRKLCGITGPVFLGFDTHALSQLAYRTVIEVLESNCTPTFVDSLGRYTPTPAISRAIIKYNNQTMNKADGIILTPSHNPPEYGGIKYNLPHGGATDTKTSKWIEEQANEYLRNGNWKQIRRSFPTQDADEIKSSQLMTYDYVNSYVEDLERIIDFSIIREAELSFAIDPLGGSSLDYWKAITQHFNLNATIINEAIDARFAFLPLDKDEKIRMDCSSAYVMNQIVEKMRHNNDYSFTVGNDPDADRHGIVTSLGFVDPNLYLSLAAEYLLKTRKKWKKKNQTIARSIVTTHRLDQIARKYSCRLLETPVGFKYFASGLFAEKIQFACEESAGASFASFTGNPWTSDKDGILLGLLAAEISARLKSNLDELIQSQDKDYGKVNYTRVDKPANASVRQSLAKLSAKQLAKVKLAGEETHTIRTTAQNGEDIGGIYLESKSSWALIRPSGTENIYKIYAETKQDENTLDEIVACLDEFIGTLL